MNTSMKRANTAAVDAAITEAAARRDAICLQMCASRADAERLMPDLIAVTEEVTRLEGKRGEIIRATFYR